jgi:hypothetical protein
MDGANGGTTFTDEGPHTLTANGNTTNSRGQSKFSTSAIYSGISSDKLSTSTHILLPQQFTWEGWVRFDSSSPGETIFQNLWDGSVINGHDNRSYRIWFQNGSPSKLGFAVSSDGDNPNSTEIFWNWTPSQNTWYYISIGRDSSNDCRAFVDGSQVGSTLGNSRTAFTPETSAAEALLAGPNGSTGVWYQDVQFSTTNRYTTTYSVPTATVVPDSDTVLLINSDSAGGPGADSSGNKNDFAVTNLVATDQVLDSPTNNFATFNPITPAHLDSVDLSEGNLSHNLNRHAYTSTMPLNNGSWYFEFCATVDNFNIGLTTKVNTRTTFADNSFFRVCCDGAVYSYNSTEDSDTFTGCVAGDIYGFAVNGTAGTCDVYQNNTKVIEISAISTADDIFFFADREDTTAGRNVVNFGQDSSFAGNKTAQGNQDSNGKGDFYYAPPAGYLALCTDNLPEPTIKNPRDHFNTILWTGSGSSPRSITGVGFQPDFLWIKDRVAANNHVLTDVVRGSSGLLYSNATTAEVTGAAQVSSYDSDGFTLGTTTYVNENGSSNTYAGWNWKAGGTASSNTDGSITSSVSANPTAGFSIVSYTSPGTNADGTVGHGLSQAPEMVIVKNLDSAYNWDVWSPALSSGYDLKLNDTAAQTSGRWSTTIPTASLVTLKDNYEVNGTDDYIAYCFHSVEGYSKVGSYTGNSSTDGPFIYTGFKPAYVMIKRYDSSTGSRWLLLDSVRNTYNIVNKNLIADEAYSESTVGDTDRLDFVSNGFKLRQAGTTVNVGSYIYLAIAESPFKTSNAR